MARLHLIVSASNACIFQFIHSPAHIDTSDGETFLECTNVVRHGSYKTNSIQEKQCDIHKAVARSSQIAAAPL